MKKWKRPEPPADRWAEERLWQRTFDSVGDAVLLLGPDMKIRRLNRAAEALMRTSTSSVIGRPCHEIVHGLTMCIDGCPVARMATTRRREENDIPVGDRWYRVVADPIIGDDGRLSGIVHVMSDITDQRRGEEALRRSEENLAQAQRIAHLGSWDWDIAAGTLAWSDEVYRIFGLQPKAFGATYEAFLARVHPDDRALVTAAVDRALADPGYAYSAEHRVVRPDGTERIVIEGGEVIRDAAGKPVRMMGTVHDVTERRTMEAERALLRQALTGSERLLRMGEMMASLAHELNQPLAAILSNAQAALRFIESGNADPVEIREILKDIVSDDVRAGEVIRGLRAMVRREPRAKQPLDLNRILGETVNLVRSELITRNMTLRTAFHEPLPLVSGDKVQLQQVALNLILNAADALAEAPAGRRQVEVRTAPADGGVRVSVLDRGPGIPEKVLKKLFEPFFTTKPQGMGMGLATSRTIVEHHGGRIRAENRPEGGAAFHVDLPAKP